MLIEESVLSQIVSARNKRHNPVFVPREKASEFDLQEAMDKLGIRVPESYAQFCAVLGVGDFNDDLRMFDPSELYTFDMPGVEFDGFVAISTDGLGNYLAFNPSEIAVEGEIAVYYCCHDPFGFGVASTSFCSFIQQLVENDFNYQELMENLSSFTEMEPPIVPQKSKPWWKVW